MRNIQAEMIQDVVGAKTYDSVRSKYEMQLEALSSQIEEIANSGVKDEFGYLPVGLHKLISMMLDCEQYNLKTESAGKPVLVDRVIKVNRYVSNAQLIYHGIDHVVIGGMYLVAPIYMLPSAKIKAASNNRYKCVMNPTEFKLPSEDECNYATLKKLSSGVYIAVAKFKNNYINEIVNSACNYDYVLIN